MTAKGKILIVDDEPMVLKLLTMQVERLAYAATGVTNGADALALLEKNHFHLLITDIIMPKMDGLALMQQALIIQPELECIVVSGQADLAIAVEAMKMGAINYIQKPVSIMELEVSLAKGMERLTLLKTLKKSQQELSRHRDHLEQLVAKRTTELARINKQLEADIKARKKAEKEAEQRRRQLIEADKMVSLGILVAGVAHEINNPNNFITMNAPILHRAWNDFLPILEEHYLEHGDFPVAGIPFSEMREHIPELFSGILDGSERIRKIVFNLRDYARQGISDMNQDIDLNTALRAALVLLANPLKKATDHLAVHYGEGLPPVRGNFQRAEQVIINLLQNAYQSLASPDKHLSVSTGHDPKNGTVFVEIADQGCGISQKNLKRILDPFFTTKRDGGGSGLGLSISAGIMEEHGGRLEFNSNPGQGTIARAVFPIIAFEGK
ncbi:MAG: response regulator [Desulfobulbaceae bacterium]|nr:response regulator [Desulfobulbaceae bacterium]HIJ91361.1 response regulator [Deltaproteobacteria bacterium]